MEKRSVKSNFIFQASYEVLLMVLPLITSPYVSRILGAENIGIYSYTYTITYYFTLFAMLGVKNYGNREISRCRDNKEQLNKKFSGILFLHIIISCVVLVVFALYCVFCKSEYRVYYIIQSLYLFGALFDISWLFFGLELFRTTVTRNAVIRIASVFLIFLLVKQISDLWIYILILAASNFASQIYLWFKLKPLVRIVRVEKKEIFMHLSQMLLLFIPTIAVSLYNYMDKVMLGSMAGTIQLGFYENSFKITSVCSSVIGSVGTVMLPRMSNVMAKGETEKGRKYIELSISSVMLMAFAMAFGISAISNDFAPIFWGKEFTPCGSLLALLAAYLPIQAFASVIRTQYLIPNRLDKQYTISLCVGAAFNVLFNYLLIPHLNAFGAVLGTIVAETSVCIVQAFYVRRVLPIKKFACMSIPYLIIGLFMFLAVRLVGISLPLSVLSLIIQIVVGAIVYGVLATIYLVKVVKQPFLINEILKLLHIKYRFVMK